MASRASSIGRRTPGRTPGRSRAQSDAEAAPTPASQVAAEIIDKYDDFESSGDDDDLIDAPVVRKQAKPWQLQYQTPFVTCAHCNEINFFDADLLRQTMHTPELRVELGRCTGCGQAIVYKAGADDLYDYVESKRRARIEAEKARRRATVGVPRLSWKTIIAGQLSSCVCVWLCAGAAATRVSRHGGAFHRKAEAYRAGGVAATNQVCGVGNAAHRAGTHRAQDCAGEPGVEPNLCTPRRPPPRHGVNAFV